MRDYTFSKHIIFYSKISQDSIFGDSPTRDLDTSIEAPFISSVAKQKHSTTQHPLHKVSTVAKDNNTTSSSEDTDPIEAATITERKPGVFHAADNGKEKEAKQEYVEETQGIIEISLLSHSYAFVCMEDE